MVPENQTVETLRLDNGLIVQFHNLSRQTVTGRWQAVLQLRVALDIETSRIADEQGMPIDSSELKAVLGATVDFTQEKVSNFVAEEDIPQVLSRMRREFSETALKYISAPEFSRKYILKSFRDAQRRNSVHEAHTRAISIVGGPSGGSDQ